MKSRLVIIFCLLLLAVLTFACSSGISKDEYNALDKKYTQLQQQYDNLKTENDSAQKKVKEYSERLNTASAWALFYDIYSDIFRYEAGIKTKYGYSGGKASQQFIDEFVSVANEAGGEQFAETVRQAFFLPLGKEKDKAWSAFHIKLAEGMLSSTVP